MVAREAADLAPTEPEIDDPVQASQMLPKLLHGQQIAPLVARLAVGVLVLSKALDRGASRAAIGISIQRARPRGVVLLGQDVGRELLGEGLPLAGGIREMHGRPVAALAQASSAETERILMDLCQRAGVSWAPPSARAARASRPRSRQWRRTWRRRRPSPPGTTSGSARAAAPRRSSRATPPATRCSARGQESTSNSTGRWQSTLVMSWSHPKLSVTTCARSNGSTMWTSWERRDRRRVSCKRPA